MSLHTYRIRWFEMQAYPQEQEELMRAFTADDAMTQWQLKHKAWIGVGYPTSIEPVEDA